MAKKKTKRRRSAQQEAVRRRAATARRTLVDEGERVSDAAEVRAREARDLASSLQALEFAADNVVRASLAQDRAALRARAAGASWGQIGRALGISQQAAHRRYAGGDS